MLTVLVTGESPQKPAGQHRMTRLVMLADAQYNCDSDADEEI